MNIIIKSFGYKGDVPKGDIYLDARVITNPFHIKELGGLTGDDLRVQEFVRATSPQVIDAFFQIIRHGFMTLPARRQNSSEQGSDRPLIICVGCAHGIHRSRAVKNILFEMMKVYPSLAGHNITKE